MFKKFCVIVDDGDNLSKVYIPAKSKQDAKKKLSDMGVDIIKVTDVSDEYRIDVNKVESALMGAGFGSVEINLISSALQDTGIAESFPMTIDAE